MIAAWIRRRMAVRHDDSGSALILALLVVLVTAITLGAVLDFTRAGLTIAPKTRDLRNETNYVQGQVDGAVDNIRGSSVFGRTVGPACPDYGPFAGPAGVDGVAGKSFRVTCDGVSVGAVGGPDQPDFAIQALGTGSEGIRVPTGNAEVTVDGGIYSRGVVSVTGSSKTALHVNGSVFAEGACTTKVTSTDNTGLHCNYPPSPPFGSDPQYLASIADTPDLGTLIGADTAARAALGADPIPTCSSPNGMVEFEPGYYSEMPTTLVDTLASSCNGSTYHFNPGRYYFDYAGLWDLGSPHSRDVVGGSLKTGYSGGAVGNACDATLPGVQFVFGGASRVSVTGSGGIELCGPIASQSFAGAPQRIVLYGLSDNANNHTSTPSPQTDTYTATSAPTSTGSARFTNPGNAQFVGEVPPAVATFTASKKKDAATLDFAGFQHVPKGSRLQSVQVRVAQALVDAKSSLTLTTASNPATSIDTGCTTTCLVDVTSALTGTGPGWRNLNSLSLKYTADATKDGGTAIVDGLELVVRYTTPTLRSQTCIGGCTFFNSTVNLNVFMHGTVYTPAAAWSVQVQNKSGTIFDRGIIVRTIDISVSSSSKQTTSPFQLPNATPQGRLVLFRGYVDGVERLRACVLYTDKTSGGAGNAFPGYGAAVRHWAQFQQATAGAGCT